MNMSEYMNPPPTQNEIILEHIQRYGGITNMEAMNEYGICRLSARIKELRDQGYNIIMQKTKAKNRYGKKISYGVYSLPANH